jgi:hypothetical protein
MNLDPIRRRVLDPLRAAGYTEREITMAIEAIAAAAVEREFEGDAVAIVADYLLAERLATARETHSKAIEGGQKRENRGVVIDLDRRRGAA